MRRIATAAILAIATVFGAITPALGQSRGGNHVPILISPHGVSITTLGWYAIGSVACTAVAPMIGTALRGRAMTISEVDRSTLSYLLGPVGWWPCPFLSCRAGLKFSIADPGVFRNVGSGLLLRRPVGKFDQAEVAYLSQS